ncbi:class I SAM-dependent methyltransferase [Fibrisoma montanum]|uniref:Class I SAM-dependent methyltransferase n=1 Tax=Fibrisoma montanum TaxID=2305895 RepID=A0A418M1H7_9BACT|nr:class I SAM-dependent methyltransferase [Fibrisoma montanum]RIV19386.1 class I SAM-dependent methyltransferase [Fibrisoma montanum]
MNAVDFHSDIAEAFDERYRQSPGFRERFRVWTKLFGRYVKPTDSVLDLGCGSGIFSSYLAGWGCTVTGIDGSAEMISLCRQKTVAANVRYVVEPLPLASPGDYPVQDVIIASSLLEYIDDMTAMLSQANQLLRPTGLLIVSMPNERSMYRRLERLLFALTGRPRYFAHIRNLSSEAKFDQLLRKMGFDVIETAYFSSYDPVSRFVKFVLPRPYANTLFVGVYQKR